MSTFHRVNHRSLAALTLILLLASALRLYNLAGVPPGLQHDEVFYAHDALSVRQGQMRLFFADNQGREPLFIYLLAASTATVGENGLAIRLPAAFCGLIGLALLAKLGVHLFGRQAGTLIVLLCALSFWPLWLSRAGLRVSTLFPLAVLSAWLYLRAENQPDLQRWALAGAALGLSLYSYAAAYVLPLIVLAAVGLHGLMRRQVYWQGAAALFATAGLIYAPLGWSIAQAGYDRATNTATAINALTQSGDAGPLLAGLRAAALMFFTQGDPLWRYNVAGRPAFNPVEAACFALGLLLLIALGIRQKKPAYLLIPAWIGLGVLPGALTDLPPSSLRTSAALPAAYLAAGFGLAWLGRQVPGRLRPLLWAGLAALSGWLSTHAYFIIWANAPEVQQVYRADLAQLAAALRTGPPITAAISTSEPNALDPFIFAYTPHGAADVRWFDGANALYFPDQGGTLAYTLEPAPHPAAGQFLTGFDISDEAYLSGGGLAYRLIALPPARQALNPAQAQPLYTAEPLAFPPDETQGIRTQVDLPAQLGPHLRLIGYTSPAQNPPGTWLPLVLHFEVTQSVDGPQPWAIFAHLLAADGSLAAGRDFLPVPPAGWRAGDRWVQFHDVPLPPDLPPGLYHVEIGAYSLADGARFPVLIDGVPAADRLLLEPVQMTLP